MLRRYGMLSMISYALCLAPAPLQASTILSTSLSPIASNLTLGIYLGTNSVPFGTLLATVGPAALNGTLTADINLDSNGNGTVTFQGADIVLQDLSGVATIGDLGTVHYSFTGLGINFVTPAEAVTNYQFSFPFTDPIKLTLNQGTVVLDSLTGALASIIGANYQYNHDFGAFPFTTFPRFSIDTLFNGTVDNGAGHLVSGPEIEFNIPSAGTEITSISPTAGLYAFFTGTINVAAVPEVSSLMLLLPTLILAAVPIFKRIRLRTS